MWGRMAILQAVVNAARLPRGPSQTLPCFRLSTYAQSARLEPVPQDLEKLRVEIESHLNQAGLVVFHGAHRMLDALLQVVWDVERHPDFREFVAAAQASGSKVVVFDQRAFSLDQIDAALDQLEECDFSPVEKRQYENRLRQLQSYEGFTSSLELSFAHGPHIYVYEVHTEWYEAFTDILGELDAALEEEEVSSDDESLGGYFSNN